MMKWYIILSICCCIIIIFLSQTGNLSELLYLIGSFYSSGIKGTIGDLYQSYLNKSYDEEITTLTSNNALLSENFNNLKKIYNDTLLHIEYLEKSTQLINPEICKYIIIVTTVIFIINLLILYVPEFFLKKIPGGKFIVNKLNGPLLNANNLEKEYDAIINSMETSLKQFLNIEEYKSVELELTEMRSLNKKFIITSANTQNFLFNQKEFILNINLRLNYLATRIIATDLYVKFQSFFIQDNTEVAMLSKILNSGCKTINYTHNCKVDIESLNVNIEKKIFNIYVEIENHWKSISQKINIQDSSTTHILEVNEYQIENNEVITKTNLLNPLSL